MAAPSTWAGEKSWRLPLACEKETDRPFAEPATQEINPDRNGQHRAGLRQTSATSQPASSTPST
jgi:hypothetical protein